jgi:hypothetical protein
MISYKRFEAVYDKVAANPCFRCKETNCGSCAGMPSKHMLYKRLKEEAEKNTKRITGNKKTYRREK